MNTFIPVEANKSSCNSQWTSEAKKGNLLPVKNVGHTEWCSFCSRN